MPNVLPNKQKKTSGFTLIELLVVITVIGALSGILLGVINSSGVRAKARDSQRKSDLKKIQTALELYFADNRAYPVSNRNGTAGDDVWEQVDPDKDNSIITALEAGYIDPVPSEDDPLDYGNHGPCANPDFQRYNYKSDGSYYFLTAIMEITTSADDSPCPVPFVGCGGGGYDTDEVCYFAQNP